MHSIERLRSLQERVAERKRPEQDVIARINTVLDEAGLPARHFSSVRPESDSAMPGQGTEGTGGTYRRQTLRVSLQDLTVRELGAFLSHWQSAQPLWTPSRIEINHARANRAETDRYDAVILITATYVAE